MIAERTRDKISAARRRGKWTGGLVPLGYSVENGKLIVEPDEAASVRDIFASYIEHRSLFRVVETFRDGSRKTKAYVSALEKIYGETRVRNELLEARAK
jgi:site-specific DNA recombinase